MISHEYSYSDGIDATLWEDSAVDCRMLITYSRTLKRGGTYNIN